MGKKKTDEKLTAAAEAEKQDALFMEEERDFDDFGTPPDDLDELTCETPLLDIDFDKEPSEDELKLEELDAEPFDGD